jgi:hypothetical protein
VFRPGWAPTVRVLCIELLTLRSDYSLAAARFVPRPPWADPGTLVRLQLPRRCKLPAASATARAMKAATRSHAIIAQKTLIQEPAFTNHQAPPGAAKGSAPECAVLPPPRISAPVIAPEWEDPRGVPIDAILFAGRRAGIVPLATEAFDWQHGTFLGATVCSETTAAITGKVGQLRRDPMAMLPFFGYHIDTSGLDMSAADLVELLSVDIEGWLRELPPIRAHFAHFGNLLPAGPNLEVRALEGRLQAAKR